MTFWQSRSPRRVIVIYLLIANNMRLTFSTRVAVPFACPGCFTGHFPLPSVLHVKLGWRKCFSCRFLLFIFNVVSLNKDALWEVNRLYLDMVLIVFQGVIQNLLMFTERLPLTLDQALKVSSLERKPERWGDWNLCFPASSVALKA